ncbi:channel protein, hemolysin III family [Luminiphilus syltensis NOR5-1B]|uniref:Channel protein, hemolysin III family n=1 Tax=Luminiphilus syltensis NOR5-1B TaxID=565045 RepID=B8KTS7_9GAMM|nr:hemolysin III family protein [Luminiphilus syltensis]EED36401.1 channel protein, hemolysin III family [Luminiphilus syltensis NOR5-1B]
MYYGERFNSISHVVGAALALVGLGALITQGIEMGSWQAVVGFSVFGTTLVLLYTMSTLYHSFPMASVKRLFQQLDHAAIYLLIAGTYTPFLMVLYWDSRGPQILVGLWILAFIGLWLDLFIERRIHALQLTIYLLMGWVPSLFMEGLASRLGSVGFGFVLGGGIAYSVGVIFYVLDKLKQLNHAHGIWHLFVLFGSMAHFVAIIGFIK